MKKEVRFGLGLLAIFLLAYRLNFSDARVQRALLEACYLLQWYARNHTLACVVPAMFIAGAIATFLSRESVLRHLGPRANKLEAYGVASTSGTVLAVCSCSVLPMFAGIYQVGAGLGPACAFLYSGPAINVMALFLTARVLGVDLGIARVVGAVALAVLIGLTMAVVFRRDERDREAVALQMPQPPAARRSLGQTAAFLASMVLLLVFSDWANPSLLVIDRADGTQVHGALMLETTEMLRVQVETSLGDLRRGQKLNIPKRDIIRAVAVTPTGYEWAGWVYAHRWYFAFFALAATMWMVWRWFDRDEITAWLGETWGFAKLIIPLLFGGVFVTGFVGALIPESGVARWVGGDGFGANLIASVIGALWYFATLTEIPILETLIGLGMGRGPALALLLAGPALSLPSIAVIVRVIGLRKTSVFVFLTVALSAGAGMIFGWFFV